MRKEIPPCTEHEVCMKHVEAADVSKEEVTAVLTCMVQRGILEEQDGKYWFTEEYHTDAERLSRIRELIVETLCSQALADHLGDVRDAEENLWEALGVDTKRVDYQDSAWERTRQLLRLYNIPLPKYLGDDDA